MDIGQRLKEIRLIKGWSQARLGRESGVSRVSINRYEIGETEMSAQTLQQLAKTLQVPITLLYGFSADQAVGTVEAVAIPILGRIPAGELKFTEDTVLGYFPAPSDIIAGGVCFWLQVSGNCMSPTFKDGHLALIRVQPEVENGEVAVVAVDNENATLKRIKRQGDIIMLKGDNPQHEMIALPAERVRIIGKVVGAFYRAP